MVEHDEPFAQLLTQGMVLKDGAVMSKSKGNVVDPDTMLQKFGADALRLYVMFVAPPEKEVEWTDAGLEGSFRFLARVWRLVDHWLHPIRDVYNASRGELEAIAEVAVAHDLVVVTDEVYEHLVYRGEHIPIAALPGMADRTLTISSGGKTFSFTGWKVGWACGRPDLVAAVRAAKQFLTYSANEALQVAIAAHAFGIPFHALVQAPDRMAPTLERVTIEMRDGRVRFSGPESAVDMEVMRGFGDRPVKILNLPNPAYQD